jgi:hypothetical protein
MQILVLGMHRSGTSAVARLLNMMGAYLGPPERIKGANPENPKGFWENDEVVDLDNRVLAAQRCLWNRLSEFDPARLADGKLATLRRRARDLVIRLDGSRPWAVKDPRMCLLLPFWRPLLEMPICVLVNRDPLEVARSLSVRNGIPLHVGIALWELHNLEALRGSIGLPRTLVQYGDLLSDPVASAQAILKWLAELGVRKLECPSDDEITAYIDPELRRQRADPDDKEDFLTPPQRRLCEALRDGSALKATEPLSLSQAAREVLKLYDATLYAEADIQHLKATLARREEEIEGTRERLTESQDAVKRLESRLSKVQGDLRSARKYDGEMKESIQAMRAELARLNARLERQQKSRKSAKGSAGKSKRGAKRN